MPEWLFRDIHYPIYSILGLNTLYPPWTYSIIFTLARSTILIDILLPLWILFILIITKRWRGFFWIFLPLIQISKIQLISYFRTNEFTWPFKFYNLWPHEYIWNHNVLCDISLYFIMPKSEN